MIKHVQFALVSITLTMLAACAGPANDSNRASQNAAATTNVAASENRNQAAANANLASPSASANRNSNATGGALDSAEADPGPLWG